MSREHYSSVSEGLAIFQDDPLVHVPGESHLTKKAIDGSAMVVVLSEARPSSGSGLGMGWSLP